MLTALDFRYAPGPGAAAAPRPPHLARRLARHRSDRRRYDAPGFDLQLARHGAEGWRATFYTAGQTAHSQTSAVASAWAPEPWVAVQRAGLVGLRRRLGESA
jgi:hypothetical protein